ncbi:uncharacterized protein RHO17_016913 [Thomomys bottae]
MRNAVVACCSLALFRQRVLARFTSLRVQRLRVFSDVFAPASPCLTCRCWVLPSFAAAVSSCSVAAWPIRSLSNRMKSRLGNRLLDFRCFLSPVLSLLHIYFPNWKISKKHRWKKLSSILPQKAFRKGCGFLH